MIPTLGQPLECLAHVTVLTLRCKPCGDQSPLLMATVPGPDVVCPRCGTATRLALNLTVEMYRSATPQPEPAIFQ